MTDSNFKKAIRQNKVKTPTQRGFSPEKWESAWSELKNSSECEDIYLAGLSIHSTLDEIRDTLNKIYEENAPKISNNDLIKLYIALSNRDRNLIKPSNIIQEQDEKFLFSKSVENQLTGNRLTHQEIAENCVDGHQKAIHQCVIRKKSGADPTPGKNPVDPLQFIGTESILSQAYDICESFWQGVIWSDYQFKVIDESKKHIEISQLATPNEIALFASQTRKQRLAAQTAQIVCGAAFLHLRKDDECIIITGTGKNKDFKPSKLSKHNEITQCINSIYKTTELLLTDEFPKEFLTTEYNDCGFTISEALNVFRILVILSIQISDKYPKDDSFFKANKLAEFCPGFNRTKLISAISKSAKISHQKSDKIIKFLTYKGEKNDDLWCNPILETIDGKIHFLTSALATPVLTRVVEHWLSSLNVNMSDKGHAYEENAIQGLKTALRKNPFISEFNYSTATPIKLSNGEEEEIDFLLKFDQTIVVGEMKSIVTTDSPISHFRTLSTLKHGTAQANRKLEFIKRNEKDVFQTLGWKFDNSAEYKYVAVVFNSSKIHSGFSINETPIIDENIFEGYFEKSKHSVLSTNDGNSEKQLAWVEIYTDKQSFIDNFQKYLSSPPQLMTAKHSINTKKMIMPKISKNSFLMEFQKLCYDSFDINSLVQEDHTFKIHTIENFKDEIEKMVLMY